MTQQIKYVPGSDKPYDITDLEHLNIQTAYVKYTNGGYDGFGYLIGLSFDHKWCFIDMSHCSCNGPLDGLRKAMGEKFDSFDAMLDKCSREVADELRDILLNAV